jgi:DNA invertase Pin-like site-specific DNA recombinase
MKRRQTPAATKPSLAVGYVRVAACPPEGSRPRLDAQAETIRAFAVTAGIELGRIFEDAGESAHNRNRPGLVALLGAVEAGQVTVVIVPDLTRLARDSGQLARLLDAFDRHGVRLVCSGGD